MTTCHHPLTRTPPLRLLLLRHMTNPSTLQKRSQYKTLRIAQVVHVSVPLPYHLGVDPIVEHVNHATMLALVLDEPTGNTKTGHGDKVFSHSPTHLDYSVFRTHSPNWTELGMNRK